MSGWIVADLETDGLEPSVIHMVGIVDLMTDEYTSYHGPAVVDGLVRLAEAEIVVGHYFRGYDAKVIRDLSNGLVTIENDRIIDTWELSRALYPDLSCHKLSEWGYVLGYPKLGHSDWSGYSQEMDTYCERDVRLNAEVFRFMLAQNEEFVVRILSATFHDDRGTPGCKL